MKNRKVGDTVDHKYLLLQLERQYYGIPIREVLGIVPGASLVPVRDMPEYLPGVTRLGDRVIPVLDLQTRLNHPPAIQPSKPFLIAAIRCGTAGEWEVGLMAHTVVNVMELPAAQTRTALMTPDSKNKCITGLLAHGRDQIFLLDVETLLFANHPRYLPEPEAF